MPSYVAVSAVLLSLTATATAHRIHPRAFLNDLNVSPAPLARDSGFHAASHRRALKKTTSDVAVKVVAALREAAAASGNPNMAAAQSLVDAALKADGELHETNTLAPCTSLPRAASSDERSLAVQNVLSLTMTCVVQAPRHRRRWLPRHHPFPLPRCRRIRRSPQTAPAAHSAQVRPPEYSYFCPR